MPKSRKSQLDYTINENDSYDESYNEMDSYSTSSNNVEDNEYFSDNDDEEAYNESNITLNKFRPVLQAQYNQTNFDDKDALQKLKIKHDKDIFKMKLSHCIEIKKIEMSIVHIDALELKKISLIATNASIKSRLINRKAEKIEKEDEKNKMISIFEGQFIDPTKTRKELYFLQKDKAVLEKEHNKKIIAFNNIIGIIDNNINSISDEFQVSNCMIDQINSEIAYISLKKDSIDNMKTDFQKKIIEYENNLEIEYDKFAKLHGWTILRYRINGSSPINQIKDIVKDIESPTISISISNSISENPTSPTNSDGIAFRASSPAPVIRKMEQPVPPSMPVPVMRVIVPIIAKPDHSKKKPCNNGNTCINSQCRFLHPPQHTIADGHKNKNELERLERIRFEQEKDEYNYYWDMYENELDLWKKQQMMHSVEAFPVLGSK